MELGLTLLRKVGPLDRGISDQLKTSMDFQMKKLAAEAKRLNDSAAYLRVANIQRLAQFEKLDPERPEVIFLGGYVDNDYPRDFEITEAVVAATEGFAIADTAGKVIAKFDDLASAESARKGAKVEMKVEVAMPKAVLV
jgi:hypothetical protein